MLACLWRWKKARAVGTQGKRDQARQGRYTGTKLAGPGGHAKASSFYPSAIGRH